MSTTTKEKTKRLNVTADQSAELNKLAREIRQLYTNTNALVRSAKEKGRAAIAEAILCGQKLNDAKKIVGHGGFLKWLKKTCKDVTERTAQKYMRLANTNHSSDLNKYDSLRQAYIGVGIIDDSEPTTEPRSEPKPADSSNTETPMTTNGEPAPVAPRSGFLQPVNVGRVAKDTGAERVRRIRQMTVALETELKALPKAHHAEARRIVAKLVAFVGDKVKSKT